MVPLVLMISLFMSVNGIEHRDYGTFVKQMYTQGVDTTNHKYND